jgi:signal transduction histidine kinase
MMLLQKLLPAIDYSYLLPGDEELFQAQVLESNHSRMKIIYPVILFIFISVVLIFSIPLKGEPYWASGPGGLLILISHISLIILTGVSSVITRVVKENIISGFSTVYDRYLNFSIFASLFLMAILTLGDEYVFESVLAYVGAVLAFGIVPILRDRMSIVVFVIPLLILIPGIWIGQTSEILRINHSVNIVAFSAIAWITSRYTYYNQKRLFFAQLDRDRLRLVVKNEDLKNTKQTVSTQLSATIAHEFNTPLQVIQSTSELIDLAKSLEEVKELNNRLPRQIKKMTKMIRKLLQLHDFNEIDYAEGMKIVDIHKAENNPESKISEDIKESTST